MRIAWAFTGAGHLLLESVEELEKMAKKHEITVMLSRASEEVLKMYGLYERVANVTGGYYREMALESDQEFSFPITGRLSMGRYDLLIVSPTTSNTIAKIVNGIADTLVTNAVAQAGKGKIKTLIVPVDMEVGDIETVLPSKLELESCENCEPCQAAAACPQDAIIPGTEIKLLKCIGCGNCQGACPFNAVSEGKIITIRMRELDVENTHKLVHLEGVSIIKHPEDIKSHN
ncbi:dihydromethanopterin reductase (acceptor) [Methanobacterium alcaliphilum]|uniref:dihydromethanopterin reductase (acceptor) n=1 Tax=Methanobacterium alcaliphilum TaxID=392018 RepID=UPI002009F801|nr:dihydromethanopterin reductase (acceptor) [Methanobacterium alcaliphilum]MCK9151099.1 dihydromethanopterin reductase (acceptor) [Methanobacterium alcaliphilum]